MKFVDMSLEELVAVYKELNPKCAPNFTFMSKEKAVKQVEFAFGILASSSEKDEAQQALIEKYKDNLPTKAEPVTAKTETKPAVKTEKKGKSLAEIAAEQGALTDEEMAAEGLAYDADGKVIHVNKPKKEKVLKTKEEISAAIAEGTKESWNNKDIRIARTKRNYISIDGNVYPSMAKLCEQYHWEKQHIPLRKIVKIQGRVNLILADGTKHDIVCLDATGKDCGNSKKTAFELPFEMISKVARNMDLPEVSEEELQQIEAEKKAAEDAKIKKQEARAAKQAEREKAEALKAEKKAKKQEATEKATEAK